MNVKLATAYIS